MKVSIENNQQFYETCTRFITFIGVHRAGMCPLTNASASLAIPLLFRAVTGRTVFKDNKRYNNSNQGKRTEQLNRKRYAGEQPTKCCECC